ncbi:hypothetical protein KNN_01487 [Bacillus thuringiensis serovar tolworthi]|uniref:Uncharacterized protein n=1 Tax=Bacillus thuringiensis subsp. tolworthi TaxID=1442 RepID=A0A9W4ESU9_BACTO|nr:hypothetical protein KNN_01487 [Bacillus thuringiensis serovar tolworthi]
MKEKLVYENTYGDYLQLGGAIEHFFDSFPDEWGSLVDTRDEKEQFLDDYYECIAVMENGLEVKVEIFLANDVEDDDDPWICKAYEIIKVEEILVQGNITEDLKRLGINATRTYGDETTSYQVYEVSEEDFRKLSDDAENMDTDDSHWKNGGWRWDTGSNQPIPTDKAEVNNQELVCWVETINDDEETYRNDWYVDLLEYLDVGVGCTAFRNVCAVTKDLAKYNNMSMAELFKKYQG